jgi:uncharacterized protein YegJ (DUF2314 family)
MKSFLIRTGLVIIVCIVIFLVRKHEPMKKSTDKIVSLSSGDTSLMRFKDTAQSQLDYLIKFMSTHDKDDTLFRYAVKSNFMENGQNEHMWVQVNEFKNDYFTGRLANEPSTIKEIKYGDVVKVYRSDVEDWMLQDFLTNTEVGGFSRKYMRSKEK